MTGKIDTRGPRPQGLICFLVLRLPRFGGAHEVWDPTKKPTTFLPGWGPRWAASRARPRPASSSGGCRCARPASHLAELEAHLFETLTFSSSGPTLQPFHVFFFNGRRCAWAFAFPPCLAPSRRFARLWKRGMAFGVVNTYDLGKCSGPFKCENLAHYGPTAPRMGWMGWVLSLFFFEGGIGEGCACLPLTRRMRT